MTSDEIISVRTLLGPNIRSAAPALEVTLKGDCGRAERLGQLVLDLQTGCGAAASGAWAVAGDTPGSAVAVIGIEDEEVARRCLAVAVTACAREGRPQVPDSALQELRKYAGDVLPGPNGRALIAAARRRGIPVRRVGRGSLLQLGHGVRQRRLWGARSDRTSAIGEMIGWEKPLAKELLRAVGIPVPEGRLVSSPGDAWTAACETGGPVVVKPARANHGRSVFIGLSGRAEIEAAYDSASAEGASQDVLVERYVSGAEHRVLIVGGHVAAAMRGDPVYAVGDGCRTIEELVTEVNCDPRRGDDPSLPLFPVVLDPTTQATLARQGYAPNSVPPAGERVLVQRNGNLSRDVTDAIHPGNRALCLLAAETVGLDIAGIDLVAEDISRPIREQGGAVLEVNPMPGFTMHLDAGEGVARPVDDTIVELLYPQGADGRIPIVAVYSAGGAALARRIHELLLAAGVYAGLTCVDGSFAGAERTRAGNCASAQAAADLLLHPRLEAAVLELTEPAIVAQGLPFDRCSVVVCAGIKETQPAAALRLLLRTVEPDGSAFVAHSAAWLEHASDLCRGKVVGCPKHADSVARLAAAAVVDRQKSGQANMS